MPIVFAQSGAAGAGGTEWWVAMGLVAAVFAAAAIWVVRRARARGEAQGESDSSEALPAREAAAGARREQGATAERRHAEAPADRRAGDAVAVARGLEKTRKDGFVGRLGSLFRGRALDASLLEEVEAVLYTADIGVATADKLLGGLRDGLKRNELGDAGRVWKFLREETRRIITRAQQGHSLGIDGGPRPYVVMVIGVNGTGKTTTIGKLASRFKKGGHKVLLVAADTFRAAAVDQLGVWAERAGVDIWKGADQADPASVAYDGIAHGKAHGYSIVIVDTAGRLHTSANLVKELEKVHRVSSRAADGAPHDVWLVLDATMGQNAIQQARIFTGAVNVTGLVLTKLDGTAKGGVVIGICDELKLPIRFIGVGEGVEDVKPFDADAFVEGLYGPQIAG